MGLRDDSLPSERDMEGHRYSDTLKDVYSFNPAIVRQAPAVDNVFGGGAHGHVPWDHQGGAEPSVAWVRGASGSCPLSPYRGGEGARRSATVGDVNVPFDTSNSPI